TRIRDDAQNAVYFNGTRVDPTADFTYDPTYRLTRATGREHLGQTGGALATPVQVADDDGLRTRLPQPGDATAMGTYTETYAYDAVGNLLALVHQVASGAWTRRYAYTEPSQIVPGETGNRLSATSLPGDPVAGPFTARYAYDAHGNTAAMPHLPAMAWDEHDRMRSSTRQVVLAGTPETTWYTYDGAGARVRKVTDRAAAAAATPVRRAERIYLGGFELHREYGADGTTVTLQRETLHVMATTERMVVAEARTVGTDDGSAQLVRFQYGNQLGSALLELDATGDVISYEEYFPHGASAYQAVRSQTETPKRYRYTGKERDEENGFTYHGARYYAPWLGRWTSCDPAGMVDGTNVYAYARNNPLRFDDPSGTQSNDQHEDPPPPPPGTSRTTMYAPDPDDPTTLHGYPPYHGDYGTPSAIYGNVIQNLSQPDTFQLRGPDGRPITRMYRTLDVELTNQDQLILGGAAGLPTGGLNFQVSARYPITNLFALGLLLNVGPSFAPGTPTPSMPAPGTASTTSGAQGFTLQARSDPGTVGGGFYGQFLVNEATGGPVTVTGAGTGIFQWQSSASNPRHQFVANLTVGGGSGTSLLNTQPVGSYFNFGGGASYTFRNLFLLEAGASSTWANRSPLAPFGSNQETRVFAGIGLGGQTSPEDQRRLRQSNAFSGTLDVFGGIPTGALPPAPMMPARNILAVGFMLSLTIGFRIPLFSVGDPPPR
ncbi:MAG: RHS repeat-associated core domain-containing protein, partial [Candidatus Eremiobacteraeota bacterium]|nr:RHS repeat-associated core domain-containing protein [Candidatus Eremiobacteraeota bacterium]